MLIIILFLPLIVWRCLRFLAIIQQKEYRLDRLKAFFQSAEGKAELIKIIPGPADLSRTGLKRPIRTLRVILIAGLGGLILTLILYLIAQSTWPLTLALTCLSYFLIPLILIIAALPSIGLFEMLVYLKLKQARVIIQQKQPLIIGVTGSYGKTTSKQIIAQVLAKKYSVFVSPKSFNTKYSLPHSIIQGFKNQQIAVLEYAAYKKGEIETLAKYLPPDIAVITGLSSQHLSIFGSLDNIIQAKAELIKALNRKSSPLIDLTSQKKPLQTLIGEQKKVYCQAADPGAIKICQAGGQEYLAYTGPKSGVRISDPGLDQKLRLFFTWNHQFIQTQLIGLHYLDAIKASIAIAENLFLNRNEIANALKNLDIPDYFIKTKLGINHCLIIDDGRTTNPQGFKAGLEILHFLPKIKNKIILITAGIIDLAAESESIHQVLAQEAKKLVDQVIYLGFDGKKEFQKEFNNQLVDNKEEIKKIIQSVDQQTVILIEGRIPLWLNKILADDH